MLVIGNGAREHAIAKKLFGEDVELQAAMSSRNPGIAGLSKRIEMMDLNVLGNYERFKDVDIVLVGPEAPLAAGVSDKFLEMGIPVVGPTRALAKLEWSKAYTRSFLQEHGIGGNPEFSICMNLQDVRHFCGEHEDVVVKPDVLTGGKGVRLTGEQLASRADIENYAVERIRIDGLVVLEEKLSGREFTLQAFTDGMGVEFMPLVRDYKRAFDGDRGPNTGSMGSFSCPDHYLPSLSKASIQKGREIMRRTIRELTETVGEYKGVLYGGFMDTERGVYLLEYNARFGDPEAINVLALLRTPLLELGYAIAEGRLGSPIFDHDATVCVYLVPAGYPDSPKKGAQVYVEPLKNSELYYASVHEDGGRILTTSSRSIALMSRGKTVAEARERVYDDMPRIGGELYYRRDIASGA